MSKSFESMLHEYREQIAHGLSSEQVIRNMHLRGFSILEAIKAVKQLYELSLREAQNKVMQHPNWREEANKVLSLEDIVQVVEADPFYYAWLDWYEAGVHQLGMVLITTQPNKQGREIKERIIVTARANEETQSRLIGALSESPDESLDALLSFVSNYSRYKLKEVALGLRAIDAIGYPSNANAIRWLVNLATDPNAPARDDAIQILQNMNADEVIPYFLAAFLNDGAYESNWAITVNNICQLVKNNAAWTRVCGPAITNLLSQYREQQENQPDPAILLSTLEQIIPDCSYAIPTIYQLGLQAKSSVLGEKARNLLQMFDGESLKPYRYHLRLLLEDPS